MKIKLTDRTLIFCAMLVTASEISRADTVYVADAGYSIITTYDLGTGAYLGLLPAGGGQPEGLAFDSAGDLFMADSYYSTIVKFTPGGGSSVFASGLDEPRGLAIDKQGNVYVANYGGSTINKFTPSGAGSVFATSANGLGLPTGLAFDGTGNLYVANVQSDSIEKFTPGGSGSVFAHSGLSIPYGLTFDQAGNLYAANSGGGIEKFSSSGADLGAFVTLDNSAVGLAFDNQGNLYAANPWDDAIDKITPQGSTSVLTTYFMNGPQFIAIVPEPSTLALLTVGLGATLAMRRRTA
jgi:trimeric autotransporter adhesin